MREILFRGKTPSQDEYFDDGEWVQGFYTRFNGEEHRIYSGYAETDCGDYYPDWCNVRPETVGQYTGLTDKNGKKIFEGDIISTDIKRPYLIVEFRDGCFMFNCNDGGEDYYDIMLPICKEAHTEYEYGEIIGNIHDNPELLKGE